MRSPIRATIGLTAAVGLLVAAPAASAGVTHHRPAPAQHVLLLSVDGLHQSDLTWWAHTHPTSALAGLLRTGTDYTDARTPFPSDSFPGMVGQVTGGNPRTTGIYYDVSYNHDLLAPGTVDCATAPRGTMVAFDESLDRDPTRLDAGQGLPDLPADILQMTGTPQSLLDPAKLPVDPATCLPVYPGSYLKVNTVFDVVHQHGLRTAWSDKHSAYQVLDGPSGTGVDDLFTPEINSDADAAGDDWTKVNSLTQQYDHYKVQAVLNEIDGFDHSGSRSVGTPAIFGMNFQSVSTAQKLPTSGGQPGGYLADGSTPGPVLASALGFVDESVASMQAELSARGLAGSTTIILSAKHGQSPMDLASLKRIDDGTMLAGLDAAWEAAGHPGPLVAGSSDDDGLLLWLTDRSATATTFAKRYLAGYHGNGTGTDGAAKATDSAGDPVAYDHGGTRRIYAGAEAARFIGVPPGDPRVPDLIGLGQHGVVYTGGTSKIAEHGGDDPQDRHVALLVAGAGVGHARWTGEVSTVQIAPTILSLLGENPRSLQAVRAEDTAVLPGA